MKETMKPRNDEYPARYDKRSLLKYKPFLDVKF